MSLDFVSWLVGRAVREAQPVLHLFSGPEVSLGARPIDVPDASKRLFAFVAVHQGAVSRQHVAGTLWPDCDDTRAAANLRSALWRLNGSGVRCVETRRHTLAVAKNVVVDLDLVNDWATRLIGHREVPDDLDATPRDVNALELLPGLSDDWVLFERERIRQRLLHAFEAQSRRLLAGDRYAEALEVALLIVCADPLRETAQRVLIECHLAEHNLVEAARAYTRYRTLLHHELGAEPDASLTELVHPTQRRELVQLRIS
jgi:DNA-binding SARP family transcriptional activator